MKEKKKIENTVDPQLKILSPREFSTILRIVGYKKKEFTDSIGKSKGYLHNCIYGRNYFVPVRYVDNLIELTGQTNYLIAYRKLKEQDKILNIR